jgi:hypothetical protein
MITIEERIARLDAMPAEERDALLKQAQRELYELDDSDIPAVKKILLHFGCTIPKTMSSPAPTTVEDRSAYDAVTGLDKYANHWSHSEESKQDNRDRIAAMEVAKQINVHKHGTPTRLRGEQIGHIEHAGVSLPLPEPSRAFDNHGPDRANR